MGHIKIGRTKLLCNYLHSQEPVLPPMPKALVSVKDLMHPCKPQCFTITLYWKLKFTLVGTNHTHTIADPETRKKTIFKLFVSFLGSLGHVSKEKVHQVSAEQWKECHSPGNTQKKISES